MQARVVWDCNFTQRIWSGTQALADLRRPLEGLGATLLHTGVDERSVCLHIWDLVLAFHQPQDALSSTEMLSCGACCHQDGEGALRQLKALCTHVSIEGKGLLQLPSLHAGDTLAMLPRKPHLAGCDAGVCTTRSWQQCSRQCSCQRTSKSELGSME